MSSPLSEHTSPVSASAPVSTLDIPEALPELVASLSELTPDNQYHLPEGFYRCDLLTVVAQQVAEHEEENGALSELEKADLRTQARHAFVSLDYSDGYPSLATTGQPFWYQLPHESPDLYDLFQHFVLLGDSGARILQDHFDLLPQALRNTYTSRDIACLRIIYYWPQRAKAFDAFDSMVRRRQRSQHASQAEDRHFHLTELLLRKAAAFVQSDAFLDGMNTKTALEALKLGVSLQRQSLGLAPNTQGEAGIPSLNMQLDLHRTMNPFSDASDWHGNTGDAAELVMLPDGTKVPRGTRTDAARVREILRDPDALHLAETLVIKMSTSSS